MVFDDRQRRHGRGDDVSEFEKSLGIAKNVLTDRLSILVAEGVLQKVQPKPGVERYHYELTPKGRALFPIFAGMIEWSNTWVFGAHAVPYKIVDRTTGSPVQAIDVISREGRLLEMNDVKYLPGPGAKK